MKSLEMKVHENVAKSYTLPASLYTTSDALDWERRKIFNKTWHFAGHISQVAKAGDYFTIEVEGESILISRAQDGELRAFYNVCLHRASKLAEGSGNKKVLTCPYHAWTYHLDGKLNKAPNFKGVEDFNPDHFCLKQVRIEVQTSFIFVNLDLDAPSMSHVFGSLFESVKHFDYASLKLARVKEDIVPCNWKVTVDNYLECDHCPVIHKGFVNTLDMDNYEITTFENYSYQGVPLRGGSDRPEEMGQNGRYYFIYPNMWLSMNPGLPNVSINQSIPIDHQTTRVVYSTYFLNPEPSKEQDDFYQFLDQVRDEDFVICKEVQRGLQSRAYTQGRFSLTENCVHHFHRLVQNSLETDSAYL